MKDSRNYQKELENIVDALEDSLFEMTDEQVLREIEETCHDSIEVKNILRRAVKNIQQKELNKAQKEYEQQISDFTTNKYSIPESFDEQRALIQSLLANNPSIANSMITAQFRDFSIISDSDLESYLKQLYELGIIQEKNTSTEEE